MQTRIAREYAAAQKHATEERIARHYAQSFLHNAIHAAEVDARCVVIYPEIDRDFSESELRWLAAFREAAK